MQRRHLCVAVACRRVCGDAQQLMSPPPCWLPPQEAGLQLAPPPPWRTQRSCHAAFKPAWPDEHHSTHTPCVTRARTRAADRQTGSQAAPHHSRYTTQPACQPPAHARAVNHSKCRHFRAARSAARPCALLPPPRGTTARSAPPPPHAPHTPGAPPARLLHLLITLLPRRARRARRGWRCAA
jgi:hypothetical protein